jgi:replication factor A1
MLILLIRFSTLVHVMNLSELRPGMENVDLNVKLLDLGEMKEVTTYTGIKHKIIEGTVSDDTDRMNLTVWNEKIEDLSNIKVGDELFLKNCFISSFKGDLSINVGRDSSIEKE